MTFHVKHVTIVHTPSVFMHLRGCVTRRVAHIKVGGDRLPPVVPTPQTLFPHGISVELDCIHLSMLSP